MNIQEKLSKLTEDDMKKLLRFIDLISDEELYRQKCEEAERLGVSIYEVMSK